MYLFCHFVIATVFGMQMSQVVSARSTSSISNGASNVTDLDEPPRRPPPPFFDVDIPIHSLYTFTCNTTAFPMIWIIGHPRGKSYHFVDKPNQNLTVCRKKSHVRGCPLSLIISHKCTGAMDNCTARIEPPDAEQYGCEADYFSLRYQCTPAPTPEFPLVPYVVTPLKRIEDDPCDAYYQRKNEYADTAGSST